MKHTPSSLQRLMPFMEVSYETVTPYEQNAEFL